MPNSRPKLWVPLELCFVSSIEVKWTIPFGNDKLEMPKTNGKHKIDHFVLPSAYMLLTLGDYESISMG
jgi:hypothetical protein